MNDQDIEAVEDIANNLFHQNYCLQLRICIKILAYPIDIERSQKHERNQIRTGIQRHHRKRGASSC